MSDISALIDEVYMHAEVKRQRSDDDDGADDDSRDDGQDDSLFFRTRLVKFRDEEEDLIIHAADIRSASERMKSVSDRIDSIYAQMTEIEDNGAEGERRGLRQLSSLYLTIDMDLENVIKTLTEARDHGKKFKKILNNGVKRIDEAPYRLAYRLDSMNGNGEVNETLGFFYEKEIAENVVAKFRERADGLRYRQVNTVYVPREFDLKTADIPDIDGDPILVIKPGPTPIVGYVFGAEAQSLVARANPGVSFEPY